MNVGSVIVPTWAKWVGLAGGLALLICAACWLNVRYFINPAVNAETARWQARWDQRDLNDQKALTAYQAQKAATERARQDEIDRIQEDAQNEINRLAALRAAADRSSERLQQSISATIARLRAGQAASTTGSGQAGDSAGLLLTQLYAEIDRAAGEYAAEADRARAAGLTCERAWDAMRNKTPAPLTYAEGYSDGPLR